MFRNTTILIIFAAIFCFGCGSNPSSNESANANSNTVTGKEIRLDPANMPPGLSANPLPPSANMPPGISLNANAPLGNKPIPGIPTSEQLRKGFTPGKTPIPGIPDEATIRKQMGLPDRNVNVPPSNVPVMKTTKK